MGLHQGFHAQASHLGEQSDQILLAQSGHDEQNRVRPGRARLGHLVPVDNEVLAQDRDVDRNARPTQIIERAAEERAVSQHRDSGGPGRLVGPGHHHRIGVPVDPALGRRAPLELRDARQPWLAQRRNKIPDRWSGSNLHFQPRKRHTASRGRDRLSRLHENLVENHSFFCTGDRPRSRSTRARAFPLSSAAADWRAPTRRSGAAPTT